MTTPLEEHRAGRNDLQLKLGLPGNRSHDRFQSAIIGTVDQDDADAATFIQNHPP